LWRSRVDGSDRLQLTFPPEKAYLPRWSPDGRRIAFQAKLPAKPWKMCIVSANGGTPEEVREGQGNIGWSPDGGSVVFSETPFGPRPLLIHLLDLTTGHLTNVPGSEGLYAPRWSPDGHHLIALRLAPDTLWLFDFATRKWEELSKIQISYHNWSHDSKYVYFDGIQNNEAAFYRFRVSDHKLERLVSLKDVRRTGWLWSGLGPDDSPLLMRDVGTEEVYSLDWDTR